MGIVKCTWDIQTNIQVLKEIDQSYKYLYYVPCTTYRVPCTMYHIPCTTYETLQRVEILQKRMWYTLNLRGYSGLSKTNVSSLSSLCGYPKTYMGPIKRTWDL